MALNAQVERDLFEFDSGLSDELVSAVATVTALAPGAQSTLVAAPGAGYRIVLLTFDLMQSGTTLLHFSLLDGVSGTPVFFGGKGSVDTPNFQNCWRRELNIQLSENKALRFKNNDDATTLTSTMSFQYAVVACAGVAVTSPNGAETWYQGRTHAITWTPTNGVGEFVTIALLNGGVVVDTLATGVDAALGTWDWAIDAGLAADTDYKVRVSVQNGFSSDDSDANFTVAEPAVAVTAPNGLELLEAGSNTAVTWDATDGTDRLVTIVLVKNSVDVETLATGVDMALETWSWDIDIAATPGSDYRVRIEIEGTALSDTSDADFEIVAP